MRRIVHGQILKSKKEIAVVVKHGYHQMIAFFDVKTLRYRHIMEDVDILHEDFYKKFKPIKGAGLILKEKPGKKI